MLPVYKSTLKLSFEKCFKLKTAVIEKDWYGDLLASSVKFVLALDTTHLWFCYRGEGLVTYDPLPIGTFKEGLWSKDLGEFFICEDEGKSYQEFNLSPAGAWWTQVFADYRTRAKINLVHQGVECYSNVAGGIFETGLAFPLKKLGVSCTFTSNSRANVSFILGSPTQRFVSWAKLSSAKPDFHLVKEFEVMEIKELI